MRFLAVDRVDGPKESVFGSCPWLWTRNIVNGAKLGLGSWKKQEWSTPILEIRWGTIESTLARSILHQKMLRYVSIFVHFLVFAVCLRKAHSMFERSHPSWRIRSCLLTFDLLLVYCSSHWQNDSKKAEIRCITETEYAFKKYTNEQASAETRASPRSSTWGY